MASLKNSLLPLSSSTSLCLIKIIIGVELFNDLVDEFQEHGGKWGDYL